jgi:hypothetical protein
MCNQAKEPGSTERDKTCCKCNKETRTGKKFTTNSYPLFVCIFVILLIRFKFRAIYFTSKIKIVTSCQVLVYIRIFHI